jgi:hypothetical protein
LETKFIRPRDRKTHTKNGKATISRAKIDIRQLKLFALERLPQDSPLRVALLWERDVLENRAFVAKMEVWTSLLRLSFKGQASLPVSNWVRDPSGNSISFPNGGRDSLEK